MLAQTLKGFTLMLPWFLCRSRDSAACGFSGLGLSLPLFDASCGFLVKLPSHRCRSSLSTQAQHDDFFFIPALFDDSGFTNSDLTRHFNALPIQMNLSTLNGCFGNRPCFEKAGRPQPLVYA